MRILNNACIDSDSMEYLEYISIIKLYQICLSHPIVCNERRQVTDPLD